MKKSNESYVHQLESRMREGLFKFCTEHAYSCRHGAGHMGNVFKCLLEKARNNRSGWRWRDGLCTVRSPAQHSPVSAVTDYYRVSGLIKTTQTYYLSVV